VTAYSDAVNDTLERLDDLGYERGPEPEGFVAHGTLCAEALATLGYAERIPAYVDGYRKGLAHHDRPEPWLPLAAEDWREALGDFSRAGDWEVLFRRAIAEAHWRRRPGAPSWCGGGPGWSPGSPPVSPTG